MNNVTLATTSFTRKAFVDAIPIMTGYFIVAFAFGVMCVGKGMPIWFAGLMCLFVYGGASQFAALALIISGASIITIGITTFLINARHVLMSIYLSKKLNKTHFSSIQKFFYGFGLTDESFAMHSNKIMSDDPITPQYMISFNIYCHILWVIGGVIGSSFANKLSSFFSFKLDYALTAMMLFVLTSLCDTTKKLFIIIISLAAMLLLNSINASPLNVIFATFISCGAGLCIKR